MARDLSPEERRVVEKLLGKGLADDAGVKIRESMAGVEAGGLNHDPDDAARRWARFEEACERIGKAVAGRADVMCTWDQDLYQPVGAGLLPKTAHPGPP